MTLRISLCTKNSKEGTAVECTKTELGFGQDIFSVGKGSKRSTDVLEPSC